MAKGYKRIPCPHKNGFILDFFCEDCQFFDGEKCDFGNLELVEIEVEGFGKTKVRRKKIWAPKQ